MKDRFEVSVIIPVYNAEHFLEMAVQSVLAIECVAEIILVEDGSPDNALAVCNALSQQYDQVKLFRHPHGENRGPGASRNLGILNAQSEYLSFLDADDYYLPNRFEESRKLFSRDSTVDFTFGGAQYETEYLRKSDQVKRMIIPEDNCRSLFDLLICRTYGLFHTNAVTIKRESLLQLGALFNTALRLHQDSELWLRMAYFLNGKAEPFKAPIAIIRQHKWNRIKNKNDTSVLQFWETVKDVFKNEPLTLRQKLLINAYCYQRMEFSNNRYLRRGIKILVNNGIKVLRSKRC